MKNLKESIANQKKKISGVYKIVSPSGKVYIGKSQHTLNKKTGAAIGQCAKGKYSTLYDYIWKFKIQ